MYQDVYNELQTVRPNWRNETEIRHSWLAAIEKELGITFDKEKFNADASYRNIIIEFKDKGLFHGRKNSPKFREAIDERLKKYIPRFSKDEGEPLENYIGIAIDGDHIVFAHFQGGEIQPGDLLPFSLESVSMVVSACKLAVRPAVTASNLKKDFGHSSLVGSIMMQLLCDALCDYVLSKNNNKIKMLYEEWRALYGQVADLSDAQHDSLNGALGFRCMITGEHRIPICLFTIHTYNSFLIKFVAAEIVSGIAKLTSYDRFSQNTAGLGGDDLVQRLQIDIEKGEIYSRAGISGFVEEVLFGWYLDACKKRK
ncbi:MAG: SAM-dependent DNA methyltransferase, partial [Clostridiales Family XIII bacterium]|nr:SAM-dependent DNA methyltransferase [Clostridiales Family XIII bacterium]